jgi:hypothetical protein
MNPYLPTSKPIGNSNHKETNNLQAQSTSTNLSSKDLTTLAQGSISPSTTTHHLHFNKNTFFIDIRTIVICFYRIITRPNRKQQPPSNRMNLTIQWFITNISLQILKSFLLLSKQQMTFRSIKIRFQYLLLFLIILSL